MKRQIIIFLLMFLLITSFAGQNDELYLNYLAAIQNYGSTFQYFLVVNVKNHNTGITREYCTEGNFLLGAIHSEYHLGYGKKGELKADSIAIHNKSRYFEFKNKSAIRNIGAGIDTDVLTYSMDELAQLEKKVNFDSLAVKIKANGKWQKELMDDKLITMYAHALFNRGILTGEDNCFGGTIVYIDRNKKEF